MRETTRHREAYAAYLALGAERSIERLHAELAAAGRTPSLRTLYEWSRCFHWQDRLAAFEHRARAAAEEAELEAIREMHARQVTEALLLQQAPPGCRASRQTRRCRRRRSGRSRRGPNWNASCGACPPNGRRPSTRRRPAWKDSLMTNSTVSSSLRRALWAEKSRRDPSDPWAWAMTHRAMAGRPRRGDARQLRRRAPASPWPVVAVDSSRSISLANSAATSMGEIR